MRDKEITLSYIEKEMSANRRSIMLVNEFVNKNVEHIMHLYIVSTERIIALGQNNIAQR